MNIYKNYNHIAHSNDSDFTDKMTELLLYRSIVNVRQTDSQGAEITLDNGTILITEGNIGCGGCGNGWYFLRELNDCANVITKVEAVCDYDKIYDEDVYHLFVYAEDKKINILTYSGSDNGYYGVGYDVYVKVKN